MLLFFFILKSLDVTQATLSNYALPFFIGLLAVVVLKETITGLMLAGGAVVFVSTLLVTVYEGDILARLARLEGSARSVHRYRTLCGIDAAGLLLAFRFCR